MIEIIVSIIAGLIMIIGYFLNRTISRLDQTEKDTYQNRLDISILTNDHNNKYDHVVEKFDTLNKSIEILTSKIDTLNVRLGQIK